MNWKGNEVREFLHNSNPENTLLIIDFDGCFYRGLCPFLFRGIANADLGIALLILNIQRPKIFLRLLINLIRLFRMEWDLHKAYKAGRLNLSIVDEQLIRFFSSNILASVRGKDIKRASKLICKLCYKGAWKFLCEIREKSSVVIVSKSFEFLLNEVKETATKKYCVNIEAYGVNICECGISADSIISRESKYRKAKELLKNNPRFQKAIILGDTEGDIAMRDAAVKAIGKSNVFFIAVNPKDKKIIYASDKAFNSWKALKPFLEEE